MAAASRLYTGLAALLLASWATTALSFTALNVLNRERSLLGSVASVSLLTFLISRLLVLVHPVHADRPHERTLAHLLAITHHDSRRAALVLLTCCCTWLYELLSKAMLLLFVTFFGGVLATILYNDPDFQRGPPTDPAGQSDASTTALAEVNGFKEQAGFDPTMLLRWIPPQAIFYLVAALWFNVLSLGLYILGHAFNSLAKVLRSSTGVAAAQDKVEEKAGRKTYLTSKSSIKLSRTI
ncbi:hypothetical protein BO71DRAFT_412960 [Aspergillus ellipticus CBS 707.79]|uniref:Uncharacterized protein n=1 Tax=Aspergillus ellipticus CBS 707.79 TaxID=1448320 RepID=A0A319CYJ4_9EURO|nr:hypothetical protein BO71DRAFT_412960 [Aspergillus ellipticus CBS 707.79]